MLEVFRRRDVGSAHDRQDADETAVRHLLGSKANVRVTVTLLVAGVLIGTLGNYLSLSCRGEVMNPDENRPNG